MLKYRNSDGVILAATHGRGLWTGVIAGPLPVTLIEIRGQLNDKNVLLNWKTSFEQNSSYFEIQKSTDGINFNTIGSINAAGNSSVQRNYHLTDYHINQFNYYRLKMTDTDGKFVYSKIILIKNPFDQQDVWIIKNPVTNSIQLRLAKLPLNKVQIDLITISGVKLLHREFSRSSEITLDISGTYLPAGIYLLRVNVDGELFSKKISKN